MSCKKKPFIRIAQHKGNAEENKPALQDQASKPKSIFRGIKEKFLQSL